MSCPRLHSWKVTEPGFGGGPSTCGASQVVLVGKESTCNAGDAGSIPRSIPPGGRAWQPTPVFLPRESHGQRSLVGCHKDLNMTEATERACIQVCRPAVWTEPSGAKLFLVSLQTRCPHLLRVCVCVCVSLLSHFSRVRLCATLWTVAYQSPMSMGFSRQEYWSRFEGKKLFHTLLITWQKGFISHAYRNQQRKYLAP